ncbi:MAG: hypothetical protein LBD41_03615 [Clostridiales Family XIII bacterium]|jgi:hypothetical protein|nr:hypothetical protein [Clostridiales Family XIII bacterium]
MDDLNIKVKELPSKKSYDKPVKAFFATLTHGLNKAIRNWFKNPSLSIKENLNLEIYCYGEERFIDTAYKLTNNKILYLEFVSNYQEKCLNKTHINYAILRCHYDPCVFVGIVHDSKYLEVEKPEIHDSVMRFTPLHIFLAAIDYNRVLSNLQLRLNNGVTDIEHEILLSLCFNLQKKPRIQLDNIINIYTLIINKIPNDKVLQWLSLNSLYLKKDVGDLFDIFQRKGLNVPIELKTLYNQSYLI